MSKDQAKQRFKYLLLILAITGLPGLTWLGFWQLERAEEKREILAQWHRTDLPQRSLNDSELHQFDLISHRGQFDNERWIFVDNRTRDGKPGYELVGLFYAEGITQPVLVNMGWLPAPLSRDQLPSMIMPVGELTLSGRLVQPARVFQLQPQEWNRRWPARVQNIEPHIIGQLLDGSAYPWLVRADQVLVPGLDIRWQPAVMSPEKHQGYALQWFMLALALAALLLYSWQQLRQEEGE
ncbi:SURF1 family protein [Marinobacterium jannaschii]|uniref:SURF1 family protein n=1 Tax=Marinobacterium jannaschii TaxID=64970 RepID=UPI0004800803|nr:SURF1 family protein [Marinobacterium jannaschii]